MKGCSLGPTYHYAALDEGEKDECPFNIEKLKKRMETHKWDGNLN